VRVLADTSALLALSRRQDQYHSRAVKTADRCVAEGVRYIGTTLILSELYSHLLYLRGPEGARTALTHLLDDPMHEWVDATADLVREAGIRWLTRFRDQRFSLVDAVSFEVMRQERVTQAFAFDHHFEVAGFELLKP
jgi:predicted nucleic acid-binding protein